MQINNGLIIVTVELLYVW